MLLRGPPALPTCPVRLTQPTADPTLVAYSSHKPAVIVDIDNLDPFRRRHRPRLGCNPQSGYPGIRVTPLALFFLLSPCRTTTDNLNLMQTIRAGSWGVGSWSSADPLKTGMKRAQLSRAQFEPGEVELLKAAWAKEAGGEVKLDRESARGVVLEKLGTESGQAGRLSRRMMR